MGRWQPTQLKTAQYMQFKSGTSLVLGIILGILVTNYTGMRFFEYIQPLAPNFIVGIPIAWDVLITGFVIGALAKPVHDILGIITQLKNLLGNSALRQREAAGAALAEGVLKLAQSDAQAMVDVPGIGPTRLQSGSAGAAMVMVKRLQWKKNHRQRNMSIYCTTEQLCNRRTTKEQQ